MMSAWKADPELPAFLRNNFTAENLEAYFTLPDALESPESNLTMPHRAQIDPATIIQIGNAVWQIVKDGKPTSQIGVAYGGAIPDGSTWQTLSGWRDTVWNIPGNYHFHYEWKNYLGTHASVDWSWTWKSNGNYQNIGKYITLGGAVPSNVRVGWGYNLQLTITPSTPLNYGTPSNPVAGLVFTLTIKVSNPLNDETVNHQAVLKGDGSGMCSP